VLDVPKVTSNSIGEGIVKLGQGVFDSLNVVSDHPLVSVGGLLS
jgi:hypothetical protein